MITIPAENRELHASDRPGNLEDLAIQQTAIRQTWKYSRLSNTVELAIAVAELLSGM